MVQKEQMAQEEMFIEEKALARHCMAQETSLDLFLVLQFCQRIVDRLKLKYTHKFNMFGF